MKKKYMNREEIMFRLNQAGSPSVAVISEETGVPKPTLYAWLASDRRARILSSPNTSQEGFAGMAKRTKSRSPSVKLDILSKSHGLHSASLQAFCQQNGVTVEELLSWRDLALSGIELAERDKLGHTRKEHDSEMAELKKDLLRKNDALAEAAALLILQKKTLGILGITK